MEQYSSYLFPGVEFVAARTDKFKSAMLTVSFLRPLEESTASGFSLLTNLLSLATKKYPTMQSLARIKDELYALSLDSFVRRRGETLMVTVEMSFLGDSYAFDGDPVLEDAVILLGEAIFSPCADKTGFLPMHLSGEKAALVEEIESVIENRHAYALKRTREIMCEGEPFFADPAGKIELVNELSACELLEYYRICLEEAPVKIVYTGESDPKAVEALLKKHLPFLPRSNSELDSVLHKTGDTVRRVTEKMEGTQSILVLGFGTKKAMTAKDRAALAVFDEMLGNSPSSRLFANVREKLGLCYYCQSHIPSQKNVMFISSGIAPGNEDVAEKAILAELEALKKGDFSKNELDNAIRSVCRGLESIEGGLQSVNLYLLGQSLLEEKRSPAETAECVSSVTREDICLAAQGICLDTVYVLEPEEAV